MIKNIAYVERFITSLILQSIFDIKRVHFDSGEPRCQCDSILKVMGYQQSDGVSYSLLLFIYLSYSFTSPVYLLLLLIHLSCSFTSSVHSLLLLIPLLCTIKGLLLLKRFFFLFYHSHSSPIDHRSESSIILSLLCYVWCVNNHTSSHTCLYKGNTTQYLLHQTKSHYTFTASRVSLPYPDNARKILLVPITAASLFFYKNRTKGNISIRLGSHI